MNPAKTPSARLGVYVHFPWCLKKCPYCDFLSVAVDPKRLREAQSLAGERAAKPEGGPEAGRELPLTALEARPVLPHEAYADAVLRELRTRRDCMEAANVRSVFFGGGTPSLWEPAALGRVLQQILEDGAGPHAPGKVEVTVECNPTSFDYEHARALLDVGVNRVSIGVQGLERGRLEFLGRLHDAPGGLRALEEAQKAGVPRISADLIFGVAGQTPEQAAAEARRVAETGITHVSAYALTIEPGTQFGALARKGRLPLLDESLVADSFSAVEEALGSLGFAHYEVSNYARQGHVAEHNLGYWRGDDYLGLGTGAWGTVRVTGPEGASRLRYRNAQSPEHYLRLWGGAPPENPFAEGPHLTHREPIDAETALSERILLGLRLESGLDLESAARELGVEAWPDERRRAADRLIARGRLSEAEGTLRIPQNEWLFADGTIAELL